MTEPMDEGWKTMQDALVAYRLLQRELAALRARLDAPVPEVEADVVVIDTVAQLGNFEWYPASLARDLTRRLVIWKDEALNNRTYREQVLLACDQRNEANARAETAEQRVTACQQQLAGEITARVAAERALEEAQEFHRMVEAGICVTVGCNTRDSAKQHRLPTDNPYCTPAYQEVCRAVEREIALRDQLTAAQAERDRAVRDAAAWKWGYVYLQDRMDSIGRNGWAHDCDEEICARSADEKGGGKCVT